MREIKFRGKREDNAEWVYGNGFVIDNGAVGFPVHVWSNKLCNWKKVIPETVGQYTGLNDRTQWEYLTDQEQYEWLKSGKTKEDWKGKEIYKGDVIKINTCADTG